MSPLFGKRKPHEDPEKLTGQYRRKILEWAEERMATGISRQAICDYLLAHTPQVSYEAILGLEGDPKKVQDDSAKHTAYVEAHRELYAVMVTRNLKGKELEKAERVGQAIQLYEANVSDCFEGGHPYQRLRILYSRQGNYVEALRVCYLGLANTKRETFSEWIEKLARKVEPEQAPAVRETYGQRQN